MLAYLKDSNKEEMVKPTLVKCLTTGNCCFFLLVTALLCIHGVNV